MRILVPLTASLFLLGCRSEKPSASSPTPTPSAPTELTVSTTLESASSAPSVTPEASTAIPSITPEPLGASATITPEATRTTPASTPEAPSTTSTTAPEAPGTTPTTAPEAPSEIPTTTSEALNATPAAILEAASASPTKAGQDAIARASPTAKTKISYVGIWTTTDAQGQPFDIVIFPNGQAVTNWTKGEEGARGERGYWREDEGRLTVLYSDGSTDILEQDENGVQHRRYSSGSPLDAHPLAQSQAKRTEGNQSALVGVWQLNKEPDGSYLYIALHSNGRAISTINGGTEGKWKANEKGALCEWPDGWVDQIERGVTGWQKRSWIGSELLAPADLSLAVRVGETRFSVEP